MRMSHKWKLVNCKHCGSPTFDRICYLCRLTYHPRPRVKKEPEVKGLEIKPFEHIGSKY